MEKFIEKIESQNFCLTNYLNESLIGILLGYGDRNSFLFERLRIISNRGLKPPYLLECAHMPGKQFASIDRVLVIIVDIDHRKEVYEDN